VGSLVENAIVLLAFDVRAKSLEKTSLSNDREVDILSIGSNVLVPMEVKTTSRPDGRTARRLLLGESLNLEQGHGAIVCMVEKIYPLSKKVNAYPVGMV
jgi:hypothetical protein